MTHPTSVNGSTNTMEITTLRKVCLGELQFLKLKYFTCMLLQLHSPAIYLVLLTKIKCILLENTIFLLELLKQLVFLPRSERALIGIKNCNKNLVFFNSFRSSRNKYICRCVYIGKRKHIYNKSPPFGQEKSTTYNIKYYKNFHQVSKTIFLLTFDPHVYSSAWL